MSLNVSIDWTELSIQWMVTCGHFLWQGFAVAIIIVVIEQLTTSRSSTRYALACASLLSLPICVMLTFGLVHNSRGDKLLWTSPSQFKVASQIDGATKIARTEGMDSPIDSPNNRAAPPTIIIENDRVVGTDTTRPQTQWIAQYASLIAQTISASYAIVVGVLLTRTSFSLFRSFKLCSTAQRITDSGFLQNVTAHASRLRLKTIPIVATCKSVSSPIVVGILRPMILLPPSLICGLDPIQLAAILCHEMAHIRRYDLFINLLQRVIESIFFFHPVVWWLSRRVTIERENCCDDMAAFYIGRITYAQALLQMATICISNHRNRNPSLASLAADGGNVSEFGYRIRRLIDAQDTPKLRVTMRGFAFSLATFSLMGASFLAFAQSHQSQKNEPKSNWQIENSGGDEVHWSTWGDRDGLLSGARLLIPKVGIQPGDPVLVEYRLKNVSSTPRKVNCYVRSDWHHIKIESKNRIRDMGIDTPDKSIDITIGPGKEFVATSYTAKLDTRGLSPGIYHVDLGSAFWIADADKPGVKQEIPHRGSLPFSILGDSTVTTSRPLDNQIHWGDAISGMRLGAKFRNANNSFADGDLVEADLWIANITEKTIECSIRLPHPMDGWVFNIENHRGDTIMLERPPMISIPFPQQHYEFKLAPGDVKLLTGARTNEQEESYAGGPAKFEISSKNEDPTWGDSTIKGRLVTHSGIYSAIYRVMLERLDIPGLRIDLDTGNNLFTVGQPFADLNAARVLDEATDKSILWGDPVGGLRLGIRQSEFARRRTVLSIGEHIDYEVWIKNETDKVVRISRDPRDLHRPALRDDRSINLIGSGMWMSFSIPPEELAKSELILPPGQSARRFLEPSHSASIRSPGSPQGRFGSDPLLLTPGKFTVCAQSDNLKSGVEEIEIIPAARLQIRKSSNVTDEKRDYAASDPSEAILTWRSGNDIEQETMFNWNSGVLIDERDLASVTINAAEGKPDQYSINLKLLPESAKWLSRSIASYSFWDDPDMVAILLDGKLLCTIRIPSRISNDTLIIPGDFQLKQAEATVKEIQSAMELALQHNLAPINR